MTAWIDTAIGASGFAALTTIAQTDSASLLEIAREWGLPMALVAVVLLAFLRSQRRREEAADRREDLRRASDERREERLLAGLGEQAKALEAVRHDVARQTAVLLATVDGDATRQETILERITAADRLCAVCPLRDVPEAERTAVVERVVWCVRNYQECLVRKGGAP